jgi:PIN domain nuclease of toxin-antitoxin system
MRLLLDTGALYRVATAPASLPPALRLALADESHQVFVSIASAWEIAIKTSLGKLALPCPLEEFFTQTTRDLLAESIGVELPFLSKVAELPPHHGDPFDRLIVAQALLRDCTVVTSDRHFAAYGVNVLW